MSQTQRIWYELNEYDYLLGEAIIYLYKIYRLLHKEAIRVVNQIVGEPRVGNLINSLDVGTQR